MLLLIISGIMSSKTVNILRFHQCCVLQYFFKHLAFKTGLLKCKSVLSLLLIKN